MKTRSIIMSLLALGAAFSLMPGNAQAQSYDNSYCREYTRTVYIGNRQQDAYGTACLQPNGDWKIVDDDDRGRVGQRFRSSESDTVAYVPVQYYTYRPPVERTRIVFVNGKDRRYYDRGWHRGWDKKWDRDHRDRDWRDDRRHNHR